MALTYTCPKCNKQRRPVRNEQKGNKNCLRCSMYGAVLLSAFGSIISQPDIQAFKEEMVTWYEA